MRPLAPRGQRRRCKPKYRKPELTIQQILAWADSWRERYGKWPNRHSGRIPDALDETWPAVDSALRCGYRGLPGGSSLPQLLCERRGVPYRKRPARDRKPLEIERILAWADRWQARTGLWPKTDSGPIPDADGETWKAVDHGLRYGVRGLPGGSSLPQLLCERRGVPYREHSHAPLTLDQVLNWADAWRARTGTWPKDGSGGIPGTKETWAKISAALQDGARGLPGGSSLAHLLQGRRGVRNHYRLPRLTEARILAWADEHYRRTHSWPKAVAANIPGTQETWAAVDAALVQGNRGLPGGSSLARLLAARRGVRNVQDLPPLTVEQILAWAEAHRRRTGTWPSVSSGPIPKAPGENWSGVSRALRKGARGLPGGLSLASLLAEHRGVRNRNAPPQLTVEQILAWADRHRRRTGKWPRRASGPILDAPGETWKVVDAALNLGVRGLPGGSSLAQMLAKHRGVRNLRALAPLNPKHIFQWAEAHRRRAGKWPTVNSGDVPESPGEKWANIDTALRQGLRGLPGGSSLYRLLQEHRKSNGVF